MWDLETGHCIKTLQAHSGSVIRLDLSATGLLISCTNNKKLECWDLNRYVRVRAFNSKSNDSIACVLVMHGGCMALVGSSRGKVQMLNLETGTVVKVLDRHAKSLSINCMILV